MIVLDTHVLVWLDAGDASLGAGARALVDSAFSADEVAVSAISFWEVAMLAVKGRLSLGRPASRWREELVGAGVVEVEVNGQLAVQAAELPDFHGDPADRLIVATAIARGARLLSADQQILAWSGPLATVDARR